MHILRAVAELNARRRASTHGNNRGVRWSNTTTHNHSSRVTLRPCLRFTSIFMLSYTLFTALLTSLTARTSSQFCNTLCLEFDLISSRVRSFSKSGWL